MNLFIPPYECNPQLLERTIFSHNARGIAHALTTGQHPLALSFTLGLNRKIDFYCRPPHAVELITSRKLLKLLAFAWMRSIYELDMVSLALRVGNVPTDKHEELLSIVEQELFEKEKLVMKTATSIPPDVLNKLTMNLASLEASLLEKDPMMPQHLRNTHSILISYPETVHLLEDSDIARLIDAAEIHTKTEIVKAAVKGKAGSGSRKKVEVSDL